MESSVLEFKQRLDQRNQEFKCKEDALREVTQFKETLMKLLQTFNKKKVWLRAFTDVDGLKEKLSQFKEVIGMPDVDKISAALTLNEEFYTGSLTCKQCRLTKLKKEFLLSLPCNDICCICVHKRIVDGINKCACGKAFTPSTNKESVNFESCCEGCHTNVQLIMMRASSHCSKHYFCSICVDDVEAAGFCYLCGREEQVFVPIRASRD